MMTEFEAELQAALVAGGCIPAPDPEPDAPDEPELRSWRIVAGADVRCYAEFSVDAFTLEEARAAAAAAVHGEFDPENWRPEHVQGDVSISAEPEDEFDDGGPAEFWDAPDPSGMPRYKDLEAFARQTAAMPLHAGGATDVDARAMRCAVALARKLFGMPTDPDPDAPAAQPAQESQGAPAPVIALPALPEGAPAVPAVVAMKSAEWIILDSRNDDESIDVPGILAGVRRAQAAMVAMHLALKAAKPFVGFMSAEAPDPLPAQIAMRMIESALALAEDKA